MDESKQEFSEAVREANYIAELQEGSDRLAKIYGVEPIRIKRERRITITGTGNGGAWGPPNGMAGGV